MIRADGQGNLYTLSDNSGYFTIKELPKVAGKLSVVFCGDTEVIKEFNIDGKSDVLVKLSKENIEHIGVGTHRYFVDLEYDGEKDTLLYQTITVAEKDL